MSKQGNTIGGGWTLIVGKLIVGIISCGISGIFGIKNSKGWFGVCILGCLAISLSEGLCTTVHWSVFTWITGSIVVFAA
jgi:hypothetical protein